MKIWLPSRPSNSSCWRFRSLLGLLNSPAKQRHYLNFYGNLMKSLDAYLVQVLDTLDKLSLTNDTLVIRTADGEMGLTHNGQRQKNFNFDEESIRVRSCTLTRSFTRSRVHQRRWSLTSMFSLLSQASSTFHSQLVQSGRELITRVLFFIGMRRQCRNTLFSRTTIFSQANHIHPNLNHALIMACCRSLKTLTCSKLKAWSWSSHGSPSSKACAPAAPQTPLHR